jgi:EAL domain
MLRTRTRDLPDCHPLLADPDDLTLVFQPIVDLAAATVAGYEALARFPGTAGPDVWFAAAADCGLAAELEALAVTKALAAVPLLPDGTFLTISVSPHLLGSAPVQDASPPGRTCPASSSSSPGTRRSTTSTRCAGRPTRCAPAGPSSRWTTPPRACSTWPPSARSSSRSTGPW